MGLVKMVMLKVRRNKMNFLIIGDIVGTPGLEALRTHISKINAKFRAAVGTSPIENPNLSGYVIKTPVLVGEYAITNS